MQIISDFFFHYFILFAFFVYF